MTADPLPEWFIPPFEGWTAEDLDRLPEGTPRLELLDGALIVMSPQRYFHAIVIRRGANELERCAPSGWQVVTEMGIRIDRRNQPEPDVLALYPGVHVGPTTTHHRPEDVALAVEVVSPDSVERDRDIKPRKLARAGIPHFWRIEENDGSPIVYVHELDQRTGGYTPIAIEDSRLKLDRPFAMDVDLARLYP